MSRHKASMTCAFCGSTTCAQARAVGPCPKSTKVPDVRRTDGPQLRRVRVKITESDGTVTIGEVHGSGGVMRGDDVVARLERERTRAERNLPLGIAEPMPGCCKVYTDEEHTQRASVVVDLVKSTIVEEVEVRSITTTAILACRILRDRYGDEGAAAWRTSDKPSWSWTAPDGLTVAKGDHWMTITGPTDAVAWVLRMTPARLLPESTKATNKQPLGGDVWTVDP